MTQVNVGMISLDIITKSLQGTQIFTGHHFKSKAARQNKIHIELNKHGTRTPWYSVRFVLQVSVVWVDVTDQLERNWKF